eukprot:11405898-Alexandrium_andersonii.AAC.1
MARPVAAPPVFDSAATGGKGVIIRACATAIAQRRLKAAGSSFERSRTVSLRACVRACVRACLRACVPACLRAC